MTPNFLGSQREKNATTVNSDLQSNDIYIIVFTKEASTPRKIKEPLAAHTMQRRQYKLSLSFPYHMKKINISGQTTFAHVSYIHCIDDNMNSLLGDTVPKITPKSS